MDARTFWHQAVTRRLKLWGGALCLGQGYYRTLQELSHTFLLGPTRTGKTRLLEWLILALSLAPQKVTTIFFDPHGHSADELLGHFALMGMGDHVIWLDPSETRRYLAYNPVAPVPIGQAGLRASAKASALLAAREVLTNAQTKIVFRDLAYEDLELIGRDMALESMNFSEIKDEIISQKFWPRETVRTIESYSESEGTNETEMSGSSLGTTFAVNEGLWGPDVNEDHYSQHEGTSQAWSAGRSSSWSHGTSEVPWYEMIPFKEVSSRTFRDIEEQFTRAMQQLKALPARHMAVKQRGQPMRIVEAPYWPDLHMPARWVEAQIERVLGQSGLYGRIEEILLEQTARLDQLTHHAANALNPRANGADDDIGPSWQPR